MSQHDISRVQRFDHPGRGRERARPVPKGRQVDPRAKVEIEALLGDRLAPARPADRASAPDPGHLRADLAAHLGALADEMGLAFAEVFETATFYAHFDVVKEGDAAIPPLTVRVCDSITCAMLGGRAAAGRRCRRSSGPACASCARPASGCATTRRRSRSGTISCTTPTSRASRRRSRRGDTHAHIPDYVDYDAYRARAAATRLLERLRSGELHGGRRPAGRSMTRRCAASAAPASRRGASGARCAASRARG